MTITTDNFGKTADGTQVSLYTITNKNGFSASVTNFGAILVKLFVPDREGKTVDVVLGHDSVEGYFANGSFLARLWDQARTVLTMRALPLTA